jgi:hypothetical protein
MPWRPVGPNSAIGVEAWPAPSREAPETKRTWAQVLDQNYSGATQPAESAVTAGTSKPARADYAD